MVFFVRVEGEHQSTHEAYCMTRVINILHNSLGPSKPIERRGKKRLHPEAAKRPFLGERRKDERASLVLPHTHDDTKSTFTTTNCVYV